MNRWPVATFASPVRWAIATERVANRSLETGWPWQPDRRRHEPTLEALRPIPEKWPFHRARTYMERRWYASMKSSGFPMFDASTMAPEPSENSKTILVTILPFS